MSCEVINPTAALPELGSGETHIHTTTSKEPVGTRVE